MNKIAKLFIILIFLILSAKPSLSQEKIFKGNIDNIFTTSLAIISTDYNINEINYKQGRTLFMANGSLYELEIIKKETGVSVNINKIAGNTQDSSIVINNIYQKLNNKYGN